MTTAYRDTATRCHRCRRVTKGVVLVSMNFPERLGVVTAVEAALCVRCRYQVQDVLMKALANE